VSSGREAADLVRREVEHSLLKHGFAGDRILVAASGGIDSTCLGHALLGLAGDHCFEVALGHVNHGLRDRESDGDEEAVSRFARESGAEFFAGQADPRPLRSEGPSRGRPTLQEAARRLRYRALLEMADEWGSAAIVTAHNADDQAETVLLRILRGCGPDGLVGIAPRTPDGRILRPLLEVPRQAIVAYASFFELSWREDRSNSDLRYARNRLRKQWIPDLAASFNPQLSRTLAGLAEAQQRDSEWIEAQVAAEATARFRRDEEGLWVDCEHWDRLPEALSRRLARRLMQEFGQGREVTRTHLARLSAFLSSGRPDREIELPGGLRVACRGKGRLVYRVEGNRAC